MEGEEICADYACKCLNIRLSAAKSGHTSNHLTTARDYIPVYVGEKGIQVIHRQLTLKSRSAAVLVDSARRNDERLQYTSISCLVCDSEAYRIALEIAQESELKEGPVIPTDDWVECEILQSKTGWVDVYVGPQGCMPKGEIARMIASEHYSPHFSIAVLGEGNVPSITNPTKFSIPPEHTCLPRLSTFILPPPYTPSHPIYLHLANVVRSLSDNIRSEAEANVAKYAQEQLSRIEEIENHLKVQLEQLWENARDSLRKAEHTRDAASPNSARRMSSPSRGSAISSSLPHAASVVREFRPSTYHVHRSEVRPRVAATSALSASLATTAAHFPRSLQERSITQSERNDQQNLSSESQSPPPYASNPSSPGTDSVKSSDSTPGLGIPRSLARNMNSEQDTSVTYRYYVIEEQEKARARAKALDASSARRQDDEIATNISGQAEATPIATDQSKAVEQQHEAPGKQQPKSATEGSPPVSTTQKTPDKKSRKVTFDVNPDVVTIKREINAEKEGLNNSTSEDDMIFDIDGSDESETENTDIEPQTHSRTSDKTGFVNTISRVRKESPERTHKNKSMAGLPSSFVALRPASLPAPSNVRPPLRTPILQHSKEQMLSPRRSVQARSSRMARVSEGEEKPLKQYERELRKLVAADVPSHRGAWSRDEVWKAFGTKGKGRSRLGSTSTTLEDNESDTEGDNETDHPNISHSYDGTTNWRNYHPSNLSSSLPVAMGPIRKLKSSMGKSSSGAPALAMLEEANEEEPSHGVEPEKVRKQAHTERDRVRSLDPGLLDFATDDDDVKEHVDTASSSRGKQYALKIIAARNAVPEEGMWRSLA